MSLRREVYLKAAESIVEMHYQIPQFPSMSMQEIQTNSSVVNLAKAFNKLHIVGTEKTIESIVKYHTELTKLIFDIIKEKIKINSEKLEINEIEERINNLSQDNMEKIKYLNGIKIQKQSLVTEKSISLLQECMGRMKILGRLLYESNIAIREEMDMKIDEQFYRNLMNRNLQEINEEFNKFIESLRPAPK